LGISTVFLRGVNTNEENLEGLKNFLIEVNPDLYIVQEFSNEKFKPVSEDFKAKIKENFTDLPFEVICYL
jgi:hypothetical protein